MSAALLFKQVKVTDEKLIKNCLILDASFATPYSPWHVLSCFLHFQTSASSSLKLNFNLTVYSAICEEQQVTQTFSSTLLERKVS